VRAGAYGESGARSLRGVSSGVEGAWASQPCERAWEAVGRSAGDSTSRDETKPRAWGERRYV